MKKLIFILLFIPLFGFSQEYTDFLPEVAWRTLVDSVVYQNVDTFTVKVNPIDLNDIGAFDKTIGNFLFDNKQRGYKIIDNSALTDGILITVVDVFKSGAAPFQGLLGFVVETPNGAFPSGLGTFYGERLDPTNSDYRNAIDLRIAYEKGQTIPFDSMRLDTGYIKTGTEPKSTVYWDSPHRTVAIDLGRGVVLQLGQEFLVHVYNGTSDTLKNNRIIGFGGVESNRISAVYASKNERHTFFGATTEDITPADSGLAVNLSGAIHDAYTGSLTAGLPFYLDTMGYLTNDRPSFPDYVYPLGTVLREGDGDGIIFFRSDGINYKSSILDAFDGAIRETFDFRTFSDGTNVYGILSNPTGADKLTLMFGSGWFDFAVPDTIQLPSGTIDNEQESYVYIDETLTMKVSTSNFPTTEHAKVAIIDLLDAVTTQQYEALGNQNINDHLKSDDDNGHILHISERIRAMDSEWARTGLAVSLSGTPTNGYLTMTGGKLWQMHKQTLEPIDMASGDIVWVINDPDTTWKHTDNLNYITKFSDGSAWNNMWGKIVVWVIGNKTGEKSHLVVNLPSNGYLSEENAINDADNYANYNIPDNFKSKAILLRSFVIRISPAGITYNPSTGDSDLRGKIANNIAGGGGGASGVTDYTQLNQTPSTLEALAFQRVDETGTSLENVLADSILLTEFDSTGFTLNANQINGIEIDAPQQFFRTGKFTATEGNNNVVFDIPFPDNDYQVFADGNTTNRKQSLLITNKLSTGFTAKGVIGTPEIEYLAIRRVDSLAVLVDSLVSIVENFDISGADGLNYSNDTLYLLAGDSILDFEVLQASSHPLLTKTGTGNYVSLNEANQVLTVDKIDLTADVTELLPDGNIASASTWNAKQDEITITTTGNSGAATFDGTTLNVPEYTLDGIGYSTPSLQEVTDVGATTTNVITIDNTETVTNKAQHKILLDDGTGVIMRHQTAYWNGSSFVGTNGYGFGYVALQSNSGGYSNGFGYYALRHNSGDYSNGFGYYALQYNEGANNSAFGHQSGYTADTLKVSNSTMLGANSLATKSNQVVLGDNNIEEVYTTGVSVHAPAVLGTQGVILSQLEDASLDVDFLSLSIDGTDINQIISDSLYTSADFNTDFAAKSTTDLSEGTNLYYTEARVSANTDVVANTAKVTNATHTGEVTGATSLTVSSGVIDYDNIATDLKGTITDNDGSFDMTAARQFNCSLSSNTTLTFTNITNKDIRVILTITSASTIGFDASIDSDWIIGDEISTTATGTYWINVSSSGTSLSDLLITVIAKQ